jgi:ATP-dependent DNA helicase DinG
MTSGPSETSLNPAARSGSPADNYLSPEVGDFLRREIVAAGGNEVFFLGEWEEDKVVKARVLSRGNHCMTPAVTGEARPGNVVIHNHPSGNLTPSEADLQVASLLGSEDVAFFIVDNRVKRLYAVVEPRRPQAAARLPESLVEDYFFPGGALSRALPSFEFRHEQAELVRAVVEACNRPGFLLAEAGTGVGKSLAYLVPTALWALKNSTRVVISTNTINLQEQLLHKDIPLVTEHLGLPVRAALIKGRGNYLCRRRAAELEAEIGNQAEDADAELLALLAWAAATEDGSRADLTELPSAAVWELVASEADACLFSRCSFFGSCFFYRARREAARAQLLVVNHHLLMADLQFPAEYGVLPRYEALVIDEVHHLEDVATGYLGETLSRIGLVMQLNRLAHQRRARLGLLRRLRRSLQRPPGGGEPPPFHRDLLARIEGEVEPAVLMLLADLAGFFERVSEILKAGFVTDENVIEGNFKLRVTNRERNDAAWREELQPLVTEFLEEFKSVVKAVAGLVSAVDQGLKEKWLAEEFFEAWLGEGRAALSRLQAQADFCGRFFLAEQESPDLIAWVEVTAGRRRNLKLMLAPLEVGALLEEKLYQRLKTLIMVSATVAVERSFDFFVGRVGLSGSRREGKLRELILASPFNYRENALVMVPVDLPRPNESGFIAALGLFLDTLLSRIGGRSLVLFTSYRAMRQTASLCRESLARRGINLILQGEGQRPQLLSQLKNNFNTVLFATDSFWEGVDVKGRALECLVVVRLPFKVPTDPVLTARLEFIAASGGNPFYDYSLPQAALKLKQGIGRLIRSRSDRGIIVVCDRRLVASAYGGRLRSVLPDCELVVAPGGEIVTRAAAFFAAEAESK